MKLDPISDALGVEVTGLDVSAMSEPQVLARLVEAFLAHHLLVVRASPLEATEFAAFASGFGRPKPQLIRSQRAPEAPVVSVLDSTYRCPEDKPEDLRYKRLSSWHTDDSYFAEPAKATLLQALAIPSAGGQTSFCNTRAAYRDLPETLRVALEGKRAVHSYDTVRAPGIAPERTQLEQAETPDVVHPIFRTHDDTRRRAIYFNPNRTDRIVGYPRERSDALLDELYSHMTRPQYQYQHTWRVGDILLWDNRCLLHRVNMDFPVGERRLHQRILLEGAVPF